MPTPSETTEDGSVSGQPDIHDLEAMVQSHIEMISRNMIKQVATDISPGESRTLTSGLGEYLVLSCQAWSRLTDSFLESAHIHRAVLDALEESKRRSHCADLSVVVSMDVEISKVR